MPSDVTRFHVTGIGPSDVQADVQSLERVVGKLAQEFSIRNVDLAFHHWTYLAPGLGEPQGYIDAQIDWSQMDFVVGAMWERYGTIMPDGVSGTEHESTMSSHSSGSSMSPAYYSTLDIQLRPRRHLWQYKQRSLPSTPDCGRLRW